VGLEASINAEDPPAWDIHCSWTFWANGHDVLLLTHTPPPQSVTNCPTPGLPMATSFWHTISRNGHRSRAGGRTLMQATRSISGQLGDMRRDRFAVLKPNDGHSPGRRQCSVLANDPTFMSCLGNH
jgi:hypothetical protein